MCVIQGKVGAAEGKDLVAQHGSKHPWAFDSLRGSFKPVWEIVGQRGPGYLTLIALSILLN